MSFDEWHKTGVWTTLHYCGFPCQQSPCDLWSLQEIIHETKPDCVIYTGVAAGGSLAMVADLIRMNHPHRSVAIGIDIDCSQCESKRENANLIEGSSVDPVVIGKVRDRTSEYERIMVILDSDHSESHVAKELKAYAGLVSKDCYLIVEDTCIGQTCCFGFGPGPAEALQSWLPSHREFQADHSRNRFGLSQHPGGYLRRNV